MTIKKGKNQFSVRYGLEWIISKQILIHPSCTNFIKEIEFYSWRTDPKNPKIIFDEPEKVDDHLMDAMRYALSDLFVDRAAKAAIRIW